MKAQDCPKFGPLQGVKVVNLTMAIAGGLAGMGAATLFLTGFEQWQVTQSAVPAMGFNGIAAAFLGGLNPIISPPAAPMWISPCTAPRSPI